MLPPNRTLKESRDFDKVKKFAKTYQSANFGLQVYKRGDDGPSKFGFVISTKIDKLAVHRNRVKRAMKEVVRQTMFDIPNGMDMLFLAKKSIQSKTTEEIMREVREFLTTTSF